MMNRSLRRFNKYLKNLVFNAWHAEANLAKTVNLHVASHFVDMAEGTRYSLLNDPLHRCVLSTPFKGHTSVTDDEISDLRMLGCSLDGLDVTAYKIAFVLGQHFRAGEWGSDSPRCGSVVTCVVNGRSLYARVRRFLSVDGDVCVGYASVEWFSKPEYPFGNPLVVRVDVDGSAVELELGCIIRVTDIDPSPVMVERCVDGVTCFMMRDCGYDTVP